MKNFMKERESKLNQFKRGLISSDEAIQYIYGYIDCMVNVGIMEEDRGAEERGSFVRELFN